MDEILLNYNFNPLDIADEDFSSLFESRRRDSCFAFVYKKQSFFYAVRDHIGTVPLYFRFVENNVKFSTTLAPLIDKNCQLDLEGLRYLIAFGSSRIKPLFKEIRIIPPGSVVKIDCQSQKAEVIYRYKFKVKKLSCKSFFECVNKLDELLLRAVKRTCKFDKVGLYLSGGIDSALTGIYLKKLGKKVNAYTSARWGKISSGLPFSKMSAEKIGVENHHIDFLETDKYEDAVSYIPDLYGSPHSSTTGIGVASLWRNSQIGKENQIYGSEGCDILAGSVPAQYISYFLDFLPVFVKKRLHKNIKYKSLLQNHLSFRSNGLIKECQDLKDYFDFRLPKTAKISLTEIYITQTPQGGEAIAGPAIRNNIIYSNPFYDADVIEFMLSIPLRFRLAFSMKKKTKIYFDKIIVRKLAKRYLSKDLIFRKKGFHIYLNRDDRTKKILAGVPKEILGIPLIDEELKFRARIFLDWCKSVGIEVIY
ncbi:MAG: asparagine synthase-related protein [Candidatus Nealsonbacteria bacterium]